MTIEEKAKAYDEALKVLHKYDGAHIMFTQDLKEEMFPELKESEDEKIKKWLIHYFTKVCDNVSEKEKKGVLDWIEKQGEQGNNEDEAILHRFSFYSYKDEPNILYLAGLYVNDEYRNKGIGTKILKIADEVAVSMKCSSILLKTEIGSNAERLYKNNGYNVFRREENQVWLEKQGESKPIGKLQLSEELYEHIRNACACIDDALSSETLTDIKDYLSMAEYSANSAFDMIEKQGEQKHAWSEEDEKILDDTIELIEKANHPNIMHSNGKPLDFTANINFLKSLKDKVQPKVEWSEKDKKFINEIEESLLAYKIIVMDNDRELANYIEKEINWLKSLKDRYTWKPSDEQMAALLVAVGDEKKLGSNAYKELYELYLQIKNF